MDWRSAAVAWPLMLLAAWIAGEVLFRRWQWPRVCAYAAVGLALGGIGVPQRIAAPEALGFIAEAALGLTLFELGYRVNPRWFRHNPWLLVAGVLQSLAVFAAVIWAAVPFGIGLDERLVLAALCVATSPAAILRVTHELHSAGQVTERLLHLCALNCLIAVLLLKGVVGYWHLETSGSIGQAAFNSVYVVVSSLLTGAVFGLALPWLNRFATSSQSTTVIFAMAVVLLTGVAQSLHLSPLLAALAFGAVVRERRIVLSHAERNFGALGDVLALFLFVYIGSLLAWSGLGAGMVLGAAVLVVRSAVHVATNLGVSRISGTTWRKGAWTGLALMPMSAFALLLLEESRIDGFDLARQSLPVVTGLAILLDVIGPLVTQRSLIGSGEARPEAG